MRIVLDAMGSDTCPVPDVEGAVLAAREYRDETIIVVGNEPLIKQELNKHETSALKIEVVHASEAVAMDDKPAVVGKSKPQSSMHIGMNLVKDGQADAFVTAGNTGAAMTIATLFTLRRIQNVKRPALSSIIRVTNGKTIILLDIGANTDSKPDWLAQFALMGQIYAQKALALSNPRVALLSNGEEETKGNLLIHETAELLKSSAMNFVGNIEPRDMLKGNADVIVSDGFVGNIAIKTLEAMGSVLFNLIREEIKRDPIALAGGFLAQRAFRRVYRQVDPFEIGGAPLLGVNGVVIIGHGRSNAKAIKNAIGQARMAVKGQVIQSITQGLADTPAST
ncbi:MAG: phosphate acyltransferase PlsX [Chloroflexi bacterium]|nr:phosphate acyltransferase PlsX [Chloroflexota bacterium]MCC6891296.1 phosphate acyltransferase PlsX [Anaerolineae bacterium]